MSGRHLLLACAAGTAIALAGCGASDVSSTDSATPGAGGACSNGAGAGCSGTSSGAASSSGSAGAASGPPACVNKQTGAPDLLSNPVSMTAQPDGLLIGDIVPGTGATPQTGQNVQVRYTGWLQDGTVFDSSCSRGTAPFAFHLGTGGVIKGWDEGVATMKVGGQRRLTIPPALAYGSQGAGSAIPPNATISFDIELVSIG